MRIAPGWIQGRTWLTRTVAAAMTQEGSVTWREQLISPSPVRVQVRLKKGTQDPALKRDTHWLVCSRGCKFLCNERTKQSCVRWHATMSSSAWRTSGFKLRLYAKMSGHDDSGRWAESAFCKHIPAEDAAFSSRTGSSVTCRCPRNIISYPAPREFSDRQCLAATC
jgi:hypothetical protein